MSTRSVIVITGKTSKKNDRVPAIEKQCPTKGTIRTIRVCRHCDGYPTANLSDIAEALKGLSKGLFANKVTKAFTKLSGGHIDEEYYNGRENSHAIYNEALKPGHFGNQGDVEWTYLVDLNSKIVNVYARSRDWEVDDCPEDQARRGKTVDPRRYATQLYPEYQKQELEGIEKAISTLEKLDFKVNPKQSKNPKKTSKKINKKTSMKANIVRIVHDPVKGKARAQYQGAWVRFPNHLRIIGTVYHVETLKPGRGGSWIASGTIKKAA